MRVLTTHRGFVARVTKTPAAVAGQAWHVSSLWAAAGRKRADVAATTDEPGGAGKVLALIERGVPGCSWKLTRTCLHSAHELHVPRQI